MQHKMNFDYIRLLMAATVMFGHAGNGILNFQPFWNGGMAVKSFFCISGFLVTGSFLSSKSLSDYFRKRIARIYPPILLTTIFLAIFGVLFGKSEPYFRSLLSLITFQDLLFIQENQIPDIYTHGAFWTLVVEFQFYLILPIIIILLKYNNMIVSSLLIIMYVISYKFMVGEETVGLYAFRGNVFYFLHFFISGILVSFYSDFTIHNKRNFYLFFSTALIVFFLQNQYLNILYPFALIFIILFLAKMSYFLGKTAIWGDISYGIYLYHFPIITVLTWLSLNNYINVVVSTFVLALLSWHFVEKKIIARKGGVWK